MQQARRVLADERDESAHRRARERADRRAEATATVWRRRIEARGQLFGLLISVAVLAVCAYGFHLGHPQPAAALAAAIVVGLAAVFVNGRRAGGPPTPPG